MDLKGYKAIPGFNPELRGLIVRIHGIDEDGDKIDFPCKIQSVIGDKITVSKFGISESETFYLNEFGKDHTGYGLEMIIFAPMDEVDFRPERSEQE